MMVFLLLYYSACVEVENDFLQIVVGKLLLCLSRGLLKQLDMDMDSCYADIGHQSQWVLFMQIFVFIHKEGHSL